MKSVSGNLSITTNEGENGEIPTLKRKSRQVRKELLQKFEGGELTVKETLTELN
jgi:hypothetical protein